jgi:uncharacterized membrane-anchored protein
MLKQGGEWREVDWQTALEFIGTDLKRVVREHGAASRRRAGLAACHARGNLPAAEIRARLGQREHRFPSPPD